MVLGVTTSVDLATFESPTFFDELQRVEANALARPVTLLQGLVALLGGLISTVGICFALLAIAPILLPILLVSGLPLALLSRRGSGLEFRFQLGQSTAGRMRYYLIELQAEREHAKELRAFGTARHLRRLWRESYEIYFAALVKHVRRLTAIAAAGSLVSTLVLAFAVGVVVELVLHGHLSLAAAGAGILAARTLSSMIASIFTGIQEILECTLFLEDLETFAERGSPQPEQEAAPAQRAPGPAAKPLDSIELDRVGFRYPESRQISLEGVSLRIEAGQIVALVGENGSGKTTLAKLISGLLRPTDGSLRWNGRDIGTYDSGEISRNVTVIFQDFAKYAFSAENNITIGDVDRPVEPGYTQEIAQRAGVHQILSGLQDGYDTMLGRVFGGVDLSIGQWQRVAIARAFYRDADFLILDEPTSALDPRAEAELFTRMRELAGGRTVLLISHRFSTVRSADKIIVLEKGRIHESGTHDELMRLGGRYAELFELQARAYR
jgi:ATP-binding cassette subfamily B protein